MNTKKHLLVGAALLGALSFGTASALEVNSSTVGGETHDPSAAADPYILASEVTNTNDTTVGDDADDGEIVLTFAPTTGNFPSGNVLFDVTITNAGFDGPIDGNAFDWSSCEVNGAILAPAPNANVSTGGGDDANTVTYVVSNLNTCEPGTDLPQLTIPVDVGASGNVSVTIGVRTEGGSPVDGGPVSYTAISRAAAFAVDITAGTIATADVNAVGGAYSDFTPIGPKDLGTFLIDFNSDAFVDLGGTNASIADVEGVTIDVVGNYGGLDPVAYSGGAQLDGDAFTVVGSTASSELTVAGDIDDLVAPIAFRVTPDGDPIAAGTYNATVALDLAATLTDPAATSGIVGEIDRNGSSETLPWTASATQAAGTGSTTFVRVSNPTDDPFGAISARVLSSTNGATVGAEGQLAATLAAGGEALFTSQDLENILGNFGRGDIEIVVEGEGAFITRLLQRPDGTLEINNRP